MAYSVPSSPAFPFYPTTEQTEEETLLPLSTCDPSVYDSSSSLTHSTYHLSQQQQHSVEVTEEFADWFQSGSLSGSLGIYARTTETEEQHPPTLTEQQIFDSILNYVDDFRDVGENKTTTGGSYFEADPKQIKMYEDLSQLPSFSSSSSSSSSTPSPPENYSQNEDDEEVLADEVDEEEEIETPLTPLTLTPMYISLLPSANDEEEDETSAGGRKKKRKTPCKDRKVKGVSTKTGKRSRKQANVPVLPAVFTPIACQIESLEKLKAIFPQPYLNPSQDSMGEFFNRLLKVTLIDLRKYCASGIMFLENSPTFNRIRNIQPKAYVGFSPHYSEQNTRNVQMCCSSNSGAGEVFILSSTAISNTRVPTFCCWNPCLDGPMVAETTFKLLQNLLKDPKGAFEMNKQSYRPIQDCMYPLVNEIFVHGDRSTTTVASSLIRPYTKIDRTATPGENQDKAKTVETINTAVYDAIYFLNAKEKNSLQNDEMRTSDNLKTVAEKYLNFWFVYSFSTLKDKTNLLNIWLRNNPLELIEMRTTFLQIEQFRFVQSKNETISGFYLKIYNEAKEFHSKPLEELTKITDETLEKTMMVVFFDALYDVRKVSPSKKFVKDLGFRYFVSTRLSDKTSHLVTFILNMFPVALAELHKNLKDPSTSLPRKVSEEDFNMLFLMYRQLTWEICVDIFYERFTNIFSSQKPKRNLESVLSLYHNISLSLPSPPSRKK